MPGPRTSAWPPCGPSWHGSRLLSASGVPGAVLSTWRLFFIRPSQQPWWSEPFSQIFTQMGETEAERGGMACPGLGGQSVTRPGSNLWPELSAATAQPPGYWLGWAPWKGLGLLGWGSGLRPQGAQPGCWPPPAPVRGPHGNNVASIPEPPAAWTPGAAWPNRPPQHGARAAPPGHGEGWRLAGPGPGQAPGVPFGRPLSGQTLLPPPPAPPQPAPPPSGGGFGGPAHPPLPRLPSSRHP